MNPTKLTDSELEQRIKALSLEIAPLKRVLSRRNSARRKASRPKVRKAVDKEAARISEAYMLFLEEQCTFCWACGRTASDKPEWYHADWIIQRAHIVNRPRVDDVRAVVSLCPCCHFGGCHAYRFPKWTLPKLTMGNLIHLKAVWDVDNFCPKFLLAHNGKRALPKAEALSPEYIESQERYRR